VAKLVLGFRMAFIVCTHKRSRPKVSPSVCEKCNRMKKCPDYKDFLYPPLFPHLPTDVIRTWEIRRKRSRRTRSKELTERQEQLTFDYFSQDESKED